MNIWNRGLLPILIAVGWSGTAPAQLNPIPVPGSVESLTAGSAVGSMGGASACPPPIVWWSAPYSGGYDPWFRPIVYPPPLVTFPTQNPFPIGPNLPASRPGGGSDAWNPQLPPGTAMPRTSWSTQAAGEQGSRRGDSEKGVQLITLGDRLFRAGNLRRASERFVQARNLDLHSATPMVRLAQLAIVRGQYAEAANLFREAQATDPGWLANAPDIQAIYGEPADFAAPLARLETHLQVNPNDRDGWLVLGAQWYLSGRTRRAADIFLRLTDRAAEPTLAAFLDAVSPREANEAQ